jgi:hypothetical protein
MYMGWGICFGLENNVLFCADGCKWKAKKSDMPKTPSGCNYVLDYFENELHSELDMIRDECPGTPAALREACEENISWATSSYENLPLDKKKELSLQTIESIESNIIRTKEELAVVQERYKLAKDEFKNYKPPTKVAKMRYQELRDQIEPLSRELDVELNAHRIDTLKNQLKSLKKSLKCELSNF